MQCAKMDNNVEIVTTLRGKILQLIDLYEKEKENTTSLRKSIELLENQLGEKESEIQGLKDTNQKLKLATAFKSGSEDAQEAKRKIGKIVREIDKCIALLNR